MLDYQVKAIDTVRNNAAKSKTIHQEFMEQICRPFSIDVDMLISEVLHKPITINFHPDRLSNNMTAIIDNLIHQGLYQGQFHTGTTNGEKSAYIGGDRFVWEQCLFSNSYPPESIERPKYGALNLLMYVDGASARFGSSFFTLKNDIVKRCTFSYGDSSTSPTVLCTSDTFVNVLAELFRDVRQNKKLLNQVISSEKEALAILLDSCGLLKHKGRNLDYCIEAHIHGDISLADDVNCFYLDESYQNSPLAEKAVLLCKKYEIELHWIPKRQLPVEDIGGLFRGAKIPMLANEINRNIGNNQGIINAAILGMVSCDSLLNPKNWRNIGDEHEVFQYIKQLWHTTAYFG